MSCKRAPECDRPKIIRSPLLIFLGSEASLGKLFEKSYFFSFPFSSSISSVSGSLALKASAAGLSKSMASKTFCADLYLHLGAFWNLSVILLACRSRFDRPPFCAAGR